MKKLVAYITAGWPSAQFSVDLAGSLTRSGVDILELGVPFSDPVADGPVIAEANGRALANGVNMEQIFAMSADVSASIETLYMGYFNSFYHGGFERFCERASGVGVSGFIIPDLPFEEARAYDKMLGKHSLGLVNFVAPTDDTARIAHIVQARARFIYLVAYAGITGSGQAEDLSRVVADIRAHSSDEVFVGFGVDESTCKDKAKGVDGVIVGSAFVKILLDDSQSESEKISKISQSAKIIKEKINS